MKIAGKVFCRYAVDNIYYECHWDYNTFNFYEVYRYVGINIYFIGKGIFKTKYKYNKKTFPVSEHHTHVTLIIQVI